MEENEGEAGEAIEVNTGVLGSGIGVKFSVFGFVIGVNCKFPTVGMGVNSAVLEEGMVTAAFVVFTPEGVAGGTTRIAGAVTNGAALEIGASAVSNASGAGSSWADAGMVKTIPMQSAAINRNGSITSLPD
jgi:hypothetical protein